MAQLALCYQGTDYVSINSFLHAGESDGNVESVLWNVLSAELKGHEEQLFELAAREQLLRLCA